MRYIITSQKGFVTLKTREEIAELVGVFTDKERLMADIDKLAGNESHEIHIFGRPFCKVQPLTEDENELS